MNKQIKKYQKAIIPTELTPNLAEFIGIMLGDGCAQRKSYQITISSSDVDGNYISVYIPNLILKLFSKKVSFRKQAIKSLDCMFASKDVCNYLANEMNFKSPKTNCEIPKQFFKNNILLKSCVRGLFDTDGGIHKHHQKSVQMHFTNKSLSLMKSLHSALSKLGYTPSKIGFNHREKETFVLYLFTKDVKRYYEDIGFSNPKNKYKYQKWLSTGIVPKALEAEVAIRLTKEEQELLLNKKIDSLKFYGYGAGKPFK